MEAGRIRNANKKPLRSKGLFFVSIGRGAVSYFIITIFRVAEYMPAVAL